MSTLLPILLTWLQQYGYPVLWFSIFIAAIGLPLPINLVLLAAGAFASQGEFNVIVLAIIGISASTAGDNIGYFIGRCVGSRVFDWIERRQPIRLLSSQVILQSGAYFKRRGGWAIFLSRFLFSGFGSVINVLAGAERYSYRRFLLYDFVGEVLGGLIPLSLGYIFGASWEAVGDVLGAFSGFVLALSLAIFLIVYLVKMRRRQRMRLAETVSVYQPVESNYLPTGNLE